MAADSEPDSVGFGLRPAEGGFSGETFVADAAGERTVVRIYTERGARRGPSAPEIDAAVLALVRGLLPVPKVLEVRRAAAGDRAPGMLVTSHLPGTRLDLLLPTLDEARRREVGDRLGALLSRLAQMPMPRRGRFVDGDLRVEPWNADLPELVASQRSGTELEQWPAATFDSLRRVADDAQGRLDAVDRTCLVHSDFNPKNLLVDPRTLEVTGLVDWEFAHAGLPVSDLGNLLRFERSPVFVGAVLGAYRAQVPDAPHDVLEDARAADLCALVDLAGRRRSNPVAARAHDLLLAIVRTGDLHAVP
ncbi:MAG: hypothetical protein AVDCRST_MAG72-2482 [uncultured Nocardioidaceae bacterium]|uniref:Aminoglycoside phosphotransferase domain-containing protein n=1 Tax=uncultured Nocardioidaceae bacterium TaxID=253824 RepID=A0A6J4MPY7_9ACTN|nr:MAG: hypothetical protein AVDCRST_MAG72-2482 [uncultured Nocardioidaceae bacterium]